MEQVLERLYNERLRSGGDCYGAFIRMVEIYSVLDEIRNHSREKFKGLCLTIELSPEDRRTLRNEIQRNVDKILRILSIGKTWIFEEFVMVVTERIQIDLVLRYLKDLGLQLEFESYQSLDEALENAVKSPRNRRAYNQAIAACRMNWGLPIKHPLLS